MKNPRKEIEKLKSENPFDIPVKKSSTPLERFHILRGRYGFEKRRVYCGQHLSYPDKLKPFRGDTLEDKNRWWIQHNIMRAQAILKHYPPGIGGGKSTSYEFYHPDEERTDNEIPFLAAIHELKLGLKRLKDFPSSNPSKLELVDSLAPLIQKRFIRLANDIKKHHKGYIPLYGTSETRGFYNKAIQGAEETQELINRFGNKTRKGSLERKIVMIIISLIAFGALAGVFLSAQQ